MSRLDTPSTSWIRPRRPAIDDAYTAWHGRLPAAA
jgi:hypothetical protein